MARGWESKAVEDQIGDAEARKESRAKPVLTGAEFERQRRREGLLLERARILREMERAYRRRHLLVLERALVHLDSELAKLDQTDA